MPNGYTDQEDAHLVNYLAKICPKLEGRQGKRLYKDMVIDVDGVRPWSKPHSAESWRSRYRDNQHWFDYQIKKVLKGKAKQKPNPGPSHGDTEAVSFSDDEVAHFARFLAENTASQAERERDDIYQELCDDVDGLWPWSTRHASAAWSGHYQRNKNIYERKIAKLRSSISSTGPSKQQQNSQSPAKPPLTNLEPFSRDGSVGVTLPVPSTEVPELVETDDNPASPGDVTQQHRSDSTSPPQSPYASDSDSSPKVSKPPKTANVSQRQASAPSDAGSDPSDEEEELASNASHHSPRMSERNASPGSVDSPVKRKAQKRPLTDEDDADGLEADAHELSRSPQPSQQRKTRKLRHTPDIEDRSQSNDVRRRTGATNSRRGTPLVAQSIEMGTASRASKPAPPLGKDNIPSLDQIRQRKRQIAHTNDATLEQLRAHARPHAKSSTSGPSRSAFAPPPESQPDNDPLAGLSSNPVTPYTHDDRSASTASGRRGPRYSERRQSRKSFFDSPEPRSEVASTSSRATYDRRTSMLPQSASLFSNTNSPSNSDVDDSMRIAANSGRRLIEKLSAQYGVGVHVVESALERVDYDSDRAHQFLHGLNMSMRAYGQTWDASHVGGPSVFGQQGSRNSSVRDSEY